MAGIRLVLEDGTYVVSDRDGLFHFEGVRPGLHVVQLDAGALLAGLEVVACGRDSRLAGRAFSQFVELREGGLERVEFRLRRTAVEASPSAVAVTAPDESLAQPFEILGFEKQDLMRIAELLVLSVIAVLVLLLVVRPLLNRLLALPGVAQPGLALAGPAGAALPPGAAAALAITGPGGTAALPGMSAAEGMIEADNMAEEIDQMIDINQVEGRVRASSLKRISDLVDQHPEQAMNIMRGWMNADQ